MYTIHIFRGKEIFTKLFITNILVLGVDGFSLQKFKNVQAEIIYCISDKAASPQA